MTFNRFFMLTLISVLYHLKKLGRVLYVYELYKKTSRILTHKQSFRLDIRKKFDTIRVVKHWNIPGDAQGLDGALSDLT